MRKMATRGQKVKVVSDCLNVVTCLNRALRRDPDLRIERRSLRPAVDVYSWLMANLHSVQADGIELCDEHVHAHTNDTSPYAKMNQEADDATAKAHDNVFVMVLSPLTGWMPDFVPFADEEGFNVGNWKRTLEERLLDIQTPKIPMRDRYVFAHPDQSNFLPPVPDFFYLQDPAGTVAKVQYLMRSRIFPSASRKRTRRIVMRSRTTLTCLVHAQRSTSSARMAYCRKRYWPNTEKPTSLTPGRITLE